MPKVKCKQWVECKQCKGSGDVRVWTGRCMGCHMDKSNGYGCCVREVTRACGLCEGKGTVKPLVHTCPDCDTKVETMPNANPKGWQWVSMQVGDRKINGGMLCPGCQGACIRFMKT